MRLKGRKKLYHNLKIWLISKKSLILQSNFGCENNSKLKKITEIVKFRCFIMKLRGTLGDGYMKRDFLVKKEEKELKRNEKSVMSPWLHK